ncbi:unnamed protein product, partial [Amoebophrya sp. A25]
MDEGDTEKVYFQVPTVAEMKETLQEAELRWRQRAETVGLLHAKDHCLFGNEGDNDENSSSMVEEYGRASAEPDEKARADASGREPIPLIGEAQTSKESDATSSKGDTIAGSQKPEQGRRFFMYGALAARIEQEINRNYAAKEQVRASGAALLG